MHKTAPTTNNYVVQNAGAAAVDKPCSSYCKEWNYGKASQLKPAWVRGRELVKRVIDFDGTMI